VVNTGVFTEKILRL